MENDPAGLMTLLASTPVGPYVMYISAAASVCGLLSTMVPKPAETSWLIVPYKIMNWVGLNFGQAKNATAVTPSSEVAATVQAALDAASASKPKT